MGASSVLQKIQEPFSAHEKFLAQKSEEAIVAGRQLKDWYEPRFDNGRLNLTTVNIGKAFRLKNRVQVFFDALKLNGNQTSIMGCVQEGEFTRLEGGSKRAMLREFVMKHFLPRAHWTAKDGRPGGLGIERYLFRAVDGSYGRFRERFRDMVFDLRELGPSFHWILLNLQTQDFVIDFGPIRKRFKEAACVVLNMAFTDSMENPSPDCEYEITVGYSFVDFAPIPRVLGFGPGKFGAALKLYSFKAMRNGDVRTRMAFMTAPRCQKVFDFGKGVPDPVYGGAGLVSAVTFGLWKTDAFHRKLDSRMLVQHSCVHQALMDGVDKIWCSYFRGGVP